LLLIAFPNVLFAQNASPVPLHPDSGPEVFHAELRVGDGTSSTYHIGEIVKVSLIISSNSHTKHWISSERCESAEQYPVASSSKVLVSRNAWKNVAFPHTVFGPCKGHGWGANVDLSANPDIEIFTLNRKYLLDQPGAYPLTWQGTFYGQKLTTNTVVLTLLPRDPAWEADQLAKDKAMLDGPSGSKTHFFEGCEAIRYLGTEDATLEMARRYHFHETYASCADDFRSALVNATNRKAVLKILESNMAQADFGLSIEYLHTLSLISVYDKHPDWCAKILAGGGTPDGLGGDASRQQIDSFWKGFEDAVRESELKYIEESSNLIASKQAKARADSILSILQVGTENHGPSLPPSVLNDIRKELPTVIGEMHPLNQAAMFDKYWSLLNSPVILNLLDAVLQDRQGHYDPNLRDAALRRMIDLSPENARAIVLDELLTRPFASNTPQVMGEIPAAELPEADKVLFERMAAHPLNKNGYYNSDYFLFRRFASRAVEQQVVAFINEHDEDMSCSDRFDLLAYLHRVDANKADELTKRVLFNFSQGQAMANTTAQHPGCSVLPLAKLYWSPAVEAQEIINLDNPASREIAETLNHLRLYGSPASRPAILEHFKSWNTEWRLKDVPPSKQPWSVVAARLDNDYLRALIEAYGWNTSLEEITKLGDMCLSDICRNYAKQSAESFNNYQHFLTFSASQESPRVILYGFFPYGGVVGIERMQSKISLFPRGTQFQVDARSKSDESVNQVLASLGIWMKANGYSLSSYR
jgi:hypothetical protein